MNKLMSENIKEFYKRKECRVNKLVHRLLWDIESMIDDSDKDRTMTFDEKTDMSRLLIIKLLKNYEK